MGNRSSTLEESFANLNVKKFDGKIHFIDRCAIMFDFTWMLLARVSFNRFSLKIWG
jgi:hypothetical protein